MATNSDNFNRANSADLGANWDQNHGSLKIVGNRVEASDITSDNGETWNADAFQNDQFSQVDLTVVALAGTEAGFGVGVRWASATTKTGYRLVANELAGTDCWLAKFVAAAYTLLGSADGEFVANDVLRLEVSGQNPTITLLAKLNGTTIITVSGETAIGSGRPAIVWSSDGASGAPAIDNWSGGDTAAAAAQLSYQPWRLRAPIQAQ